MWMFNRYVGPLPPPLPLSLYLSFSRGALVSIWKRRVIHVRTVPRMMKGFQYCLLSPYDSLEANHKIVIEVSYAVTLERHDMLVYPHDFWALPVLTSRTETRVI